MQVKLSESAADELAALPPVIRARVVDVFERLGRWPAVSGAKPLRYGLKGRYRIRTGDYRVIFHVEPAAVVVTRIANRRDVYEE